MPDAPDLRHGRSYRALFPVVRPLVRLLVTVLGPVRVHGRPPRHGGFLLVANHLSDVDPIVIQAVCPRGIHFMAKSELFAMRGVGPFIRWCGTFPVRRGAPDRAAIRHALDLLRAGEVVGIFPEGQLSETGTLAELQPGVALLARGGGVPVVCAALRGTPRIIPYGSLTPRPAFGGVSVTWGAPMEFAPDADPAEVVRALTAELRRLGAP